MLFLPSQPIFSPLTHHRTWGMQEWAAGDKGGVPHPPPQFLDSHEWALLGCQPWWGASAGSRRSRNHVLSHTLTVAAWMEKYHCAALWPTQKQEGREVAAETEMENDGS